MSDTIKELLKKDDVNLQEILQQEYEHTRTIAAEKIRIMINKRLHDLPNGGSLLSPEGETWVSPEKIRFLAEYIGCSEKTVERQLKCGTVQTQQKPGRDFAIKLAFALNLNYYEAQGLLALTAHPPLMLSDTTPENLRDLIIFKWLETDKNELRTGTKLSNCISELAKYNCPIL